MLSDTPNVVLVDGRNLLFRETWTHQSLTHDGEPTGGIYGFLKTLLAVWRVTGRPRFEVCWEGTQNWRRDLYPEYKDRKKGPRDHLGFDTRAAVNRQTSTLKDILTYAGVAQWSPQDGECDDALFTLARHYANDGELVYLLTQDRDLYQAVDYSTRVMRVDRDGEWEVISDTEVFQELRVDPVEIASFKALAGDASDNIPGARGIGPKGAAKLVAAHGDIGEIVKAAHSETWAGTPRERKIVLAAADELATFEKLTSLRWSVLSKVGDYPDRERLAWELRGLGLHLAEEPDLGRLCRLGS